MAVGGQGRLGGWRGGASLMGCNGHQSRVKHHSTTGLEMLMFCYMTEKGFVTHLMLKTNIIKNIEYCNNNSNNNKGYCNSGRSPITERLLVQILFRFSLLMCVWPRD